MPHFLLEKNAFSFPSSPSKSLQSLCGPGGMPRACWFIVAFSLLFLFLCPAAENARLLCCAGIGGVLLPLQCGTPTLVLPSLCPSAQGEGKRASEAYEKLEKTERRKKIFAAGRRGRRGFTPSLGARPLARLVFQFFCGAPMKKTFSRRAEWKEAGC